MKKLHIVLLVYIVVGIILLIFIDATSPRDFFSRYRTAEAARMMSGHYDDTQTMIGTVRNDDRYLDFLFDESGALYCITIERSHDMFGERYRVRTWSETDLNQRIQNQANYYNAHGTVYWENDSNIFTSKYDDIYWTILKAGCDMTEDNITGYDFIYHDEQYVLYVKNETGT